MCMHGFVHYACGHKKRLARRCELADATSNPFYLEVACPNYQYVARPVDIKCGEQGPYYCSATPDGARITDAETFLKGVEEEARTLDARLRHYTLLWERFDKFARSKNLSHAQQAGIQQAGYQEAMQRTQQAKHDRQALQDRQRQAVQLITYAKDHADDVPQDVGRNDDGTTQYSIFPAGFGGYVVMAPAQVGAPPPATNPGERPLFNPALLQGNAQEPLMGFNQMAHQAYGLQSQAPAALDPAMGYGAMPTQPSRYQYPPPYAGVPQFMPQPAYNNQAHVTLGGPQMTAQDFEKEKQVRDLQAQYGRQLAGHQHRITAERAQRAGTQQMGSYPAPHEPEIPESRNATTPVPKRRSGKSKSPIKTEDATPLRRSTRARAKVVKYRESPELAEEPSSREQSPVKSDGKSDGWKESPEKSESSSHSEINVRKRRHSSEDVKQEIEELNDNETKKSSRPRAALTSRIADYQRRSGAADAPAIRGKRRPRGSDYARGGGGRAQSTMSGPSMPTQQYPFAYPGVAGILSNINPNNALGYGNVTNNPYGQAFDPGNNTQFAAAGQENYGTQQRRQSPSRYSHPQPVRGQPSSMLEPLLDDSEVTGAHNARRQNPAQGTYANMFGDAPNAYGGMGMQYDEPVNNFNTHTGGINPQQFDPRFNVSFDPVLQQMLDPLPQQTQDASQQFGYDPSLFQSHESANQAHTMGNLSNLNANPGLVQPQQNVTIPSFRGSITLPASSNLFNRQAAQSLARGVANPLAPRLNVPNASLGASIPSGYQFSANQTPAGLPPTAHYEHLGRSFDNIATLTPSSAAHAANAAERTTDPRKKPTPASDDPSPRKRVRLSLPGEENVPVWPASWRREQRQESQENVIDPFLTADAPQEDLNIDNPRNMDVLNSSFDPGAAQEAPTAGNTEELSDVYLQAMQADEMNTQGQEEQAANVLMNLVNNVDDTEPVDGVDWNLVNEDAYEA